VIAFFSVSASKRGVYILPAYPAGALLLGQIIGRGAQDSGTQRCAAYAVRIGCVILAVIGMLALMLVLGLPLERLVSSLLHPDDVTVVDLGVKALRDDGALPIVAAILVVAGAAAAMYIGRRGTRLLAAVALYTVVLVALFGGIVGPIMKAVAESRTFRPFVADVLSIAGDEPLAFYRRTFDYGVIYYAGRHIRHYRGTLRGAARRRDTRPNPKLLLLWEEEATQLGDRLRILARSSGTGPKGRHRLVLGTPQSSEATTTQ
jgi:hypothetical protein